MTGDAADKQLLRPDVARDSLPRHDADAETRHRLERFTGASIDWTGVRGELLDEGRASEAIYTFDLFSDTVTRPTGEMRRFMASGWLG